LSSSTSTKTQFKSNILKHFCHWHPHHPQPHLLNLEIDDAAISCLFVALERLCLLPLHYLLNGLWPLWHNYYTLTLQHLATGINRTFPCSDLRNANLAGCLCKLSIIPGSQVEIADA
jgi:hypothetical protein